jgi:A-macroglobulin TED domain/A-macroglobulin receptor binding domain
MRYRTMVLTTELTHALPRYGSDYRVDQCATASPVAAKAKRYVEEGHQRLLGYQSPGGGFAYWADSDPDVALTAYALRFLNDASQVTTVNKSVSQKATQWLISQQLSDGSWKVVSSDKKEDPRQTAMLTALVTRSLATLETASLAQSSEKTALFKALDFLESRADGFDEPYLIASYSLASSLAGETARANKANKKLQTLARAEGSRSYWELETNTPFYGWGLAGRIETTALAVQALARQRDLTDQETKNLQARGLLFLIFNKDRFGVWYSTQATINVLDAILASITDLPWNRIGTDSISLQINGNALRNIPLPTDVRTIAPVTVDLSADLKPGVNKLSFSRGGDGLSVGLQVVNTYYIPWQTDANLAHVRASESEGLRLQLSFDKFEARVTEEITCRVKAERIGFRGYGMLLAEIGLPPGVDVDRESLDTAVKNSNWSINQYDVLPDRVVVYLWPRAGGSEFSFKFRPRVAMTAKAAPSTIYDYYNPEAKAVVAPGTFVVR